MESVVRIIGAGLAGCEAAWQCARRGVQVELFEMRPVRSTPAHQTSDFAELVCSNSLKSESENSAPWLLKQEMRRANSFLLRDADAAAVPAGHALAGEAAHHRGARGGHGATRKRPRYADEPRLGSAAQPAAHSRAAAPDRRRPPRL